MPAKGFAGPASELLQGRARDGRPENAIADLVGSVDALPADLSTRKKACLKKKGYGR